MKNTKTIKSLNYILIVVGGIIAIYANANQQQNILILIVGIIMLMIGVYRLSSTIPSKQNKDKTNFIEEEEE